MAAEERVDEVEIKVLSKHIVADPRICHGRLTIRGTRILVDSVLDQVSDGDDWETIVSAWGGKVSRDAISEAVNLARRALMSSHEEWRQRALTELAATG